VAILKGKPDGGQGGKLGHSNMAHWEFTEEIKKYARKRRRRRRQAKVEVAEGLAERETIGAADRDKVNLSDEFSQ
jgi:hypothetical protein